MAKSSCVSEFIMTTQLTSLKPTQSISFQNSIGSKVVEITAAEPSREFLIKISNKHIYGFKIYVDSVWDIIKLLEELSCTYEFRGFS